MSKVFGRILEITDLQTVSNINNLDIELYEAKPMSPRGWTQIFTYQNTIGYMDELERVCKLSINPKCKFLFEANGPDLYYSKLRVIRQVCKDCRNKIYGKGSPGSWTDDNTCLVGAWFPKNCANPIRPEYGNIATVYCPAPVVEGWVSDYFIPKIYSILIDYNKAPFSSEEMEMIMRGDKYHKASREHKKAVEAGVEVNSKAYEKTLFAQLDTAIYNRVGIDVDDTNHAGREVILPPPIWCPHKKEHEEA